MIDRATISAFRFGFGFRPGEPMAHTTADLIASVQAVAERQATISWETRLHVFEQMRLAQRGRRRGRDGAQEEYEAARKQVRAIRIEDVRDHVAGPLAAPVGFGERIVAFWADHFAVSATSRRMQLFAPDLPYSAISPHAAGPFERMLFAAVTHPAMLVYLDQHRSFGPTSPAGLRRGRGLNENLAREVLELHSLGVGGGYTQADVRGLALILTGLSVDRNGFTYLPRVSEPGRHMMLGKIYGSGTSTLGDIQQALADIARHPDTARHIAEKLIVHFVGAPAPEDWVMRIADAYLSSGGELSQTYAAFLDDPRAWQLPFAKAKSPHEFIVSSLRAAGATEVSLRGVSAKEVSKSVVGPMASMGQPIFKPPGPDGWEEAPEAWITPPGLAARILWAHDIAERFMKDRDPRVFLRETLRDAVTPKLEFAVGGAESRAEGVALVMASPEFNRR